MSDEETAVENTLQPYAVPPRPGLPHPMRLARPAKCGQWNWRWRRVAAIFGAVAGLALVVLGLHHFSANHHPAKSIVVGPVQMTPLPHDRPMALGMLSLEQQLSRCTLIVRARISDYHDTLVTYDVLHVVYGEYDKPSLQFDTVFHDGAVRKNSEAAARTKFSNEQGREPNDAELLAAMMTDNGILKGREVLLLLGPWPGKPGAYLQQGTMFDVPPEHRLNDQEAKIIEAIANGAYLEPVSEVGDVFEEILRRSPLVLRATLETVNADASVWKAVRLIKGKLDTATLTVSHSMFRRRAAALVNAAAALDQTLAKPELRTAAIDKQTQALVAQELTNAREAVLFLENVQADGTTATADLTARAYDKFDQMEKDVGQPTSAIGL